MQKIPRDCFAVTALGVSSNKFKLLINEVIFRIQRNIADFILTLKQSMYAL